VELVGPVEITRGPLGGFRHARVVLRVDGELQSCYVDDRDWGNSFDKQATIKGIPVTTTKLQKRPPKRRP